MQGAPSELVVRAGLGEWTKRWWEVPPQKQNFTKLPLYFPLVFMYYIWKFLTIKRIKTKASSSIKFSLGNGREYKRKLVQRVVRVQKHLSTPWLNRRTSSFSHEPETEPNYISPPSLQGWETSKNTPASREKKEMLQNSCQIDHNIKGKSIHNMCCKDVYKLHV